nr:hypothetical protein GCM10020093_057840 [Planobispora longispora]
MVRLRADAGQGRPRLNPILTVSESSLADIHRDFNVPQANMRLIPLGVDTRYFHPRPELPKRPGSIVAVASADSPMKGVATLLRAVAKLATERDVNLTVVSKPTAGGPTEKLVAELSCGTASGSCTASPTTSWAS